MDEMISTMLSGMADVLALLWVGGFGYMILELRRGRDFDEMNDVIANLFYRIACALAVLWVVLGIYMTVTGESVSAPGDTFAAFNAAVLVWLLGWGVRRHVTER